MERWAVLLCLGLLATGVRSQMHTTVEVMDDSCDAKLTALWDAYRAPPVAPVAGCDTACLAACYDTLNWAIYSEKQQDCPLQVDIIRCFHVYRPKWIDFVNDCALFQYGTSGSSEGESSSSSSSSSSSAEGAASTSTAAEGAAPTTTTAAEGAAPTTTTAAEGAAPTTTTAAEGAAPTTTTAAEASPAADAAGRRRRILLQEAEAALGSGSGNGNSSVNVYNGCFPLFNSAADFEEYINGEWVFETDSPAVGITLSVLFYLSLVLVGFGIPEKAKFWKRLFKRKPQQLARPAQPAAAAADEADALVTGDADGDGDGGGGGDGVADAAPPPPPLVQPLVGAASGKMAEVPEGEITNVTSAK